MLLRGVLTLFFVCFMTSSALAMPIYVKTLTDLVIPLDVEPSDSVAEIKAKITARMGVPASRQQLIFASKALEDGRTLADYEVPRGATLHLVLQVRDEAGSLALE